MTWYSSVIVELADDDDETRLADDDDSTLLVDDPLGDPAIDTTWTPEGAVT